jgi:SnoaL-like domain
MLERLRDAQNAHDAEGMAALFAEDYASSQPLHAGRAFVGRAQVLENWTAVLRAYRTLFRSWCPTPSTAIPNGASGIGMGGMWMARRWPCVASQSFVVRGDLIVEGRLYMEPVDTANEDIEAAVQELYKPPPGETP